MRLRCPAQNCPIEVPDDMAGMQIRCPHCEAWLVVDPKYAYVSSEKTQAGVPDMGLGAVIPKPKPTEPIRLENQLYDGLPPLALMMALHQRKGDGADDYASRYPMTEDDWKALSAFEAVLVAVMSLRTTLVVGAVALLINLLAWAAAATPGTPGPRPIARIGTLAFLGACLLVIYLGSRALRRINLGLLVQILPWSAFGVALVVAGNFLLTVVAMSQASHDHPLGFMTFVSVPFNLIAMFDSGRSAWRVGRSLEQVSPPEISHRLTEALRYLE